MEGRQRRSFMDDYKRQTVDLVASSGRSIGLVAKELGLRDSVLRRWVEQRGADRNTPSDANPASYGAPARSPESLVQLCVLESVSSQVARRGRELGPPAVTDDFEQWDVGAYMNCPPDGSDGRR
jgi:transposase